jgi:hypothetical protein
MSAQVELVNRSKYTLALAGKDANGYSIEPPLVPPMTADRPGILAIDADLWNLIKEHKGARTYLKRGWIIARPVAVKSAKPKKSPLEDMSLEDAAEFVSFQAEHEELEGWLETEKRDPVKAAIRKRLRLMAKG